MSTVGFPSELKNEIDMSLPEGINSYSVRVVPSNVSQVVSSTQTLTASSSLNLNGTSTNIIFDIPTGAPGTHIDHRFTTISFRSNYEIVNTPNAAVISQFWLRSGAHTHFDRATLYNQSGGIVDDITNFGLVNDTMIQLQYNVQDRDCMSQMYGFSYERGTTVSGTDTSALNNNQGHKVAPLIATLGASSSNYYSYCFPLMNSLIGQNASKFFNIGKTGKLQYVLQSAAILPLTIVTGTATTAATFRCTLDNIQLNLEYIDLGESVKLLNRPRLQYYNGTTFRVSSNTIPASTSGNISLLTGIKGNSIRGLFSRFTESSTVSTAGCLNFLYDSKCPSATSISWNINGMLYPPNPVDLIHQPANCLAFTQQANSNFNNYEFKSGLVPNKYFIRLATGGTFPTDADYVFTDAGTATCADGLANFLWGINLEKVSRAGIMDGLSILSGNVFLQMVWACNNSNAVTAYFISKQDIVYVLDSETGELTSRT